jgi:hypothetical protein
MTYDAYHTNMDAPHHSRVDLHSEDSGEEERKISGCLYTKKISLNFIQDLKIICIKWTLMQG